ncbi:hypothetical protein [Planktothricoides raciborskii]|uniref:Uncharacterized protein n=1 Tax=Planktothricoides raciborskii GIHE-MW2 TaxID=2792601 RepID=A0AAU8JME9_9CYAN
MECGEETRFLGVLGFWGYLWGSRNRVSVVGIRGYRWDAIKKPGFWGFWSFGVSRGDLETGFLLWVSGVICGMRRRNPVSGVLGLSVGI